MRDVNQDPLENFFSEVRRRCGRNDAPNAHQFAAAFKYAAISANEKVSEGTNCEPDDSHILLQGYETEKENQRDSTTFTYKFRPLKDSNTCNYSSKDLNGLVYITGAAAAKLNHQKCRKKLLAACDAVNLKQHLYSFIKLKGASHYPSSKLFEIGLLAFTAFKQMFEKFLYQNRRNVKARLKQYTMYDEFDTYCCEKCFDIVIDKIFNTLVNCFLKRVKFSLKAARNQKVKTRNKRNRKAIRMNLFV